MLNDSISYPAAFFAGLLSFFSPCIFPLIPAYFTFITGFSIDELTNSQNLEVKKKIFFSTISYVLGFSFIFVIMGASASLLGGFLNKYFILGPSGLLKISIKDLIRIFGGILIIIMGFHLSGIFRIKSLDIEKRIDLKNKPIHFLGTFVVGMAFGAGWSPCIGPLLGSILGLAVMQDTVYKGVILLCIYSAGLAIPFIVLSFFAHFLFSFIKRINKKLKYANITAGLLLIIIGLLLLTNRLSIFYF